MQKDGAGRPRGIITNDVRYIIGRGNSPAHDANLVARTGLAGSLARVFLCPGALAAGGAVELRPGYGPRLLRAGGGWFHRLAEPPRTAGADAVAELVGTGRSALRSIATLRCHAGRRVVFGTHGLRDFRDRHSAAAGRNRLCASAGVSAVPAVFHDPHSDRGV